MIERPTEVWAYRTRFKHWRATCQRPRDADRDTYGYVRYVLDQPQEPIAVQHKRCSACLTSWTGVALPDKCPECASQAEGETK